MFLRKILKVDPRNFLCPLGIEFLAAALVTFRDGQGAGCMKAFSLNGGKSKI